MTVHHFPDSARGPAQADLSELDGELVATEKLDGGALTLTRDAVQDAQPWDRPATALWTMIAHHIPDHWRVCGESMWARRGVAYQDLPGAFIVHGIWDETDTLLGWDDTVDWAERLELPVVPVLYRGANLVEARAAWGRACAGRDSEGYVVRRAGRIPAKLLRLRMLCWVRPRHERIPVREPFEVNEFA